jgi:hypothetical protein
MRGCFLLNFPRFAEATKVLRDAGAEVISPAEEALKEGVDPAAPQDCPVSKYEAWMKRDFAWIRTCDAICLLPGWEQSPGAKRELALALALDLEIIVYESKP